MIGKEEVLSETPPAHGGDVYNLARTLKVKVDELLDFSANINPLGYPPGLDVAAQEAMKLVCHYPDRGCLELREKLAAYHQLTPQQILVGNGSTELIYLVVRALRPQKGLIVVPAFSEYEQAFKVAGVPVDFHLTLERHNFTLESPFDPRGADLVFLANPASPSGALLPGARLKEIVGALDGAGVYVVLDEAFVDFVEEASLKACLGQYRRLMILRSFTKFFGIPGLRLGYLLAAPELVARLAALQEPWSVNSLAQALGLACLADPGYIAQSRELVHQERAYLFQGLSGLKGCVPFPSAVNYLLVKLSAPTLSAAGLRAGLFAEKILIRDASNFKGLSPQFFRVAVRRRPENKRLLAALKHCLEKFKVQGSKFKV